MLIAFVNCQKEEVTKELQTENQEQTSNRNIVSSHDIPEVMTFLRSKSNDKLEFKFNLNKTNTYSSTNDPHENDIVITQAMEDQIVQVIKDGKSNYAFKTKEKFSNYFLNLVVVQTINGYYMYFAKYVPSLETIWDGKSLETFNGTQYVYSDAGKFREKYYYSNGTRGLIPCECPSGGGGEEGCDFETWYICNFRNSLHQFELQCNCHNSPEGCSGFIPVQVLVCNGINPTSIQPNSINYTSNEECYCWIDEGPTGGSGGSTGGGNNNNCPNAQPCTNELEELNEFCECELSINPVTPVNPEPNYGKDINICLGNTLTVNEINTLNANPTIEQLYDYLSFDNFGNCNPENPEFAELAAEALLDGGEFDEEDNIITDSTFTNNLRVKCVYDKLKNLSNTTFKSIINDYFGSTSNAHIKFDIGTNINGEEALTKSFIPDPTNVNGTSYYVITLDSAAITNYSTIELALALIHESIHAELMERCYRLGLLNTVSYNSTTGLMGVSFNSNPNNVYFIGDLIFSLLVNHYFNYPDPSQWNHNLFNIASYRTEMAQNLMDIHPSLNDSGNDFLSNINSDTNLIEGPYTLQQCMDYISWIGLESTDEYNSQVVGVVGELAKKNYIENASRVHYTNNCN